MAMFLSLLAVATASSALLVGLIHLVITLVVVAIIYFILDWILGALAAPAMLRKLVLILCALLALYFVVIYLLAIVPA